MASLFEILSPLHHNGTLHEIGATIVLKAEEAKDLVEKKVLKFIEDAKEGVEYDLEALKARAIELGVEFASNIGAAKLAARIAEKEAQGDTTNKQDGSAQ